MKSFLNYNKDNFNNNDHPKCNTAHKESNLLGNYRLLRFDSAGISSETHKSNYNRHAKEILVPEENTSLSSDDLDEDHNINDHEYDEEFQVVKPDQG